MVLLPKQKDKPHTPDKPHASSFSESFLEGESLSDLLSFSSPLPNFGLHSNHNLFLKEEKDWYIFYLLCKWSWTIYRQPADQHSKMYCPMSHPQQPIPRLLWGDDYFIASLISWYFYMTRYSDTAETTWGFQSSFLPMVWCAFPSQSINWNHMSKG